MPEPAPEIDDIERITSEVTNEAVKRGWTDKEAWVAAGNPAEDHIGPDQYLFKGNIIGQVHRIKRDSAALEKRLKDQEVNFSSQMKDLNTYHEVQQKHAIEKIKSELAQAGEDGDAKKVVELSDQLVKEVKAVPAKPKATPAVTTDPNQPPPPTEYQEFVGKPENNWFFDDNDPRTKIVFATDREYAGVKSPAWIIDEVERRLADHANPDKKGDPKVPNKKAAFERNPSKGQQRSSSDDLNTDNFSDDEKWYWNNVAQPKLDAADPKDKAQLRSDYMKTINNSRTEDGFRDSDRNRGRR